MIKPKVKKDANYDKMKFEQAPRKSVIVEWSGFANKEHGLNRKELKSGR